MSQALLQHWLPWALPYILWSSYKFSSWQIDNFGLAAYKLQIWSKPVRGVSVVCIKISLWYFIIISSSFLLLCCKIVCSQCYCMETWKKHQKKWNEGEQWERGSAAQDISVLVSFLHLRPPWFLLSTQKKSRFNQCQVNKTKIKKKEI